MRTYTSDQSGGTDSGDATEAWQRGYGQTLTVRDGRPFNDMLDDLRAGREVHLDVWHAAVGGPCLSGSGAYGHTMVVAPDNSDGRWAVSDPWCNPPKWAWVAESKLRAGAEEWGGRVTLEATAGRPDWLELDEATRIHLIRVAAKVLTNRCHPGAPAPADEPPPPADTGGGAIMYTVTKALPIAAPQPEGVDMAIRTNKVVSSSSALDLPEGTPFYEDANLANKAGTVSQDSTVPYIGLPKGETAEGGARAVIVVTGQLSDNTEPWIVYVKHDVGEPYSRPAPESPPEPDAPNVADAIAKRDAEWQAWLLEGAPSSQDK